MQGVEISPSVSNAVLVLRLNSAVKTWGWFESRNIIYHRVPMHAVMPGQAKLTGKLHLHTGVLRPNYNRGFSLRVYPMQRGLFAVQNHWFSQRNWCTATFICSFHGLLSCSPKGRHSKERRAIANHKDTRLRTRTILLLNKLLCQVYQMAFFFLQWHFLDASPLLLPGVSMPPFIQSGMFLAG